jgi:hypothetical protein
MRALKASIRTVVAAMALILSLGATSYAAEDEASNLSKRVDELYRTG